MEVQGNGGTYLYTLWVETEESQPHSRVAKESLYFDEKPVIAFQNDLVHLFDENNLKNASYPFEADRSAVAAMGPRRSDVRLVWFKQWLNNLYCLRVDPSRMEAEAKKEAEYPDDDLSNFAAWYGHIIQEQTGSVLDLQRSLREIISGFDTLDLRKVGRTARVLRASFRRTSDIENSRSREQQAEFDFDELPDGQRSLIALYTILYCIVGPKTTICLDEPDNFLALPEIQPWLFELTDRIDDQGGQVFLISHHPELIDLLAPKHGVVFSRAEFGPVRVEQYHPDALGRISASEQIARGWDRG